MCLQLAYRPSFLLAYLIRSRKNSSTYMQIRHKLTSEEALFLTVNITMRDEKIETFIRAPNKKLLKSIKCYAAIYVNRRRRARNLFLLLLLPGEGAPRT